ncbi:sigma-E processing peptidase SpoIIGA [Halalkalibacter urbisdiaboli]|uniref:sigma-E processing peptidase SpoIIGA n=1 Tax=Halalkalibacter urbisdiaboli TaxID=1960589 RepID=UPI000B451773|nr:sigma-E processing peptidase SpoIIGA [Halalkalibacter urbisdiaboli]
MTLYLDVIWFLNLCIDYLLIALTALVLKRPFVQMRFLVAAVFASLVVFFMFTPYGMLFYQPWMKALYSAVIVLIAFGFKRFTYFIQGLLMFYFVTFMTGGGLFALHYFWQTEVDILTGLTSAKGMYGSKISWVFVFIGFPLVWYFAKQRFETIEVKRIQYDQLASIDIVIEGYTFTMQGLIDSGNQLYDPITKVPVMIIEAELLYDAFGKTVVQEILSYTEQESTQSEQATKLMSRLRIIPYRVIGQSTPFLTAIKPDRVTIKHDNKLYEVTRVLIGIQERELSPEGAYQCIVHPKLLINQSISLAQ